MTRESLFYKILSGIHIVFFASILSFLTVVLSGTLMLLPVLGAVFFIGKDSIYKRINVNDSVIATFFKYLKKSLTLLRFIPLYFMMILNVAGMIVAAKNGNLTYSIICLSIISMLLVIMFYLAGYFVFVMHADEKEDKHKASGKEKILKGKSVVMEVIALMLLKPQFVIPIFAGIVLCVFFFSTTLLIILCFLGTFFLTALEAVIFIQILWYKKLIGILDEEEEYAYLVDGSIKKGITKGRNI
ncbi:hypothetical protein acsn021_36680 [Anaerocolumna cellulosilytica]|uniref:Uncharacterized protein n=1 Tax=Anaerocolumna cellulosilytica TaxID=433286 RepID=A0A6S6R411_9FIRM|nr:hypothetical protein [Anaerocolumna cellulosilytica]MBB5195063.1 hypothetical protein [Anaerocolumna cellulosilytica]BCJ96099.1 hypothetical protein acsn021_36680 [Anaerocolumna cellulosilytica]